MQHIYGITDGPFGYNMPSYWFNSGGTLTGLNLFVNCTAFATIASRDSIRIGSSTYYGVPDCNQIGKILTTEVPENINTQDNNNITTQS